jgi:aldehyde dehydrogenase (NAD+)
MKIRDKDELGAIFERQGANRWNVASTSSAERVAKLERLRGAILRRQGELYAALRDDFRKPETETWLSEVVTSVEEIDFAKKRLGSWMRDKKVGGAIALPLSSSRVRYEPKGRVLIMSPWNYPFQLLVAPLVAAIAAGNCVIAKPSNKTPRTAEFVASLLEGIFSEDEIAVVEGAGATLGELLLELPFDHVFFTGSPTVGARVGEAAARVHAGLTLELGGKSPTVLLDGADIGTAARRIMWGKGLNAGQTCIAPDYLFCPAAAVGEFARAARSAVESFYGKTEEERRASPNLARIVDQRACGRLEGLVKDAVAKGAVAEFGARFDIEERYAAPTLLTGVAADMAIMGQEIFGPILPVIAYDSPEEVVDYIRARPKPLALYVFSRGRRAAEELISRTTSGSACINDLIIQIGNPNLPFGGVGMSGTGNYHGFFGFKTFSHERNVLAQGPISVVSYFYPPYGARAQERLKSAFKRLRRLGK